MFVDTLVAVAAALDARGIPYMVIGGQAVLLYGEPRLTRDIDITLGVGIERSREILDLLPAAGLRPAIEDPLEFARRTMVLPARDATSGVRVDIVFSFTPYETQAISRARVVSLGGGAVRFASPEDVVIHKVFAGRARDMDDVASILRRNLDLDLAYVRRWLADFDAAAEGGALVDRFEAILREE